MPESPLSLIVGLGNPGAQYSATRHNVGWMVLDKLAARGKLEFRTQQAKAVLARGTLAGQPVILAKPQTYMNLSGQAVAGLVRFYKVPLERVLIIYDELDLPLGTIRLRERGSAAGHNGLTSVIQQLGTPDIARLRLGIGRPPGGDGVAWVLGRFSKDEQSDLALALELAADAVELWLTAGIAPAMNRYNSGGSGGRGAEADPRKAARPAPAAPATPPPPASSPRNSRPPSANIVEGAQPPPDDAPPLRGLGAQIAALQARLGLAASHPAGEPPPATRGDSSDDTGA